MTDTEVLNAVRIARASRKGAHSRANNRYNKAAHAAFKTYGSTDVEQAARANEIRRADRIRVLAIELADTRLRTALANLKARAGIWSDLVSEEV